LITIEEATTDVLISSNKGRIGKEKGEREASENDSSKILRHSIFSFAWVSCIRLLYTIKVPNRPRLEKVFVIYNFIIMAIIVL